MTMRRVFVSWPLHDAALARLASRCDVAMNPDERVLRADELRAGAAGAFGLLTTLRDVVDDGLLASSGARVVANCAVGFDNIDVAAARARQVWVTNTPGVLTETTADLAFGLIFALLRRIAEGDRLVRAGRFEGWHPGMLLGRDVFGKTLGVVGMGRIGNAVARRALACGMQVRYHRGRPEDTACVSCGLDDLLGTADVVSLHLPLSPGSVGLIGAPELARMKPTAYLVNTARGAIVDTDALIEALQAGRIAGAALDVYPGSPERPDPRLFTLDNVVLTPHIGSASHETRRAMADRAVDNLLAALAGERPPNLV